MSEQEQQLQQTDVPISLPNVEVATTIENDSMTFNSMEPRQEEFQSAPYYSESPSFAVVHNEIPPRSGESRNPAISNEEMVVANDYSISNSLGVFFKVPPQKAPSALSYSQAVQCPMPPPMKESLLDNSSLPSYPSQPKPPQLPINGYVTPSDKLPDQPELSLYPDALVHASKNVGPFSSSEVENPSLSVCDYSKLFSSSDKRLCNSPLDCPKRIRSAYNYFSQDFFNKRNESIDHHDTIQEAAAEWKKLPEKEREFYIQRNREDQERYRKEMEMYKRQFQERGIPVMLTKKDERDCLYDCVQRRDVKLLAKFMLFMNKDNFDETIAFVSAVIKSLEQRKPLTGVSPGMSSMEGGDPCFDVKPTYTCPFAGCSKEFKSLRNLREHKKTHEPDRKKCFICEVAGCGKSFLTMSGLRKHRLRHERANQQYVCEYCSDRKVFKTKEGYLLHYKNKHTQERSFPCKMGCNRTFARREDLRLHIIRCHTHEKPYVCSKESCGKAFASSSELKRHLRLHPQ